MADINITLGFDAETSSIRRLQSQIRKALKDTTPEVDIRIGNLSEAIRNITRGLDNLRGNLTEIDVDDRAFRDVQRLLSQNITIDIQDVNPTDRALRNLRRELQEALTDLDITTRLRTRASSGGLSRQEAADVRAEARKQAQERDLSTAGTDLKKQQEAAFQRVQQAQLALALANQELAEATKQNLGVLNQSTEIFRQLNASAISGTDALKRLSELKVEENANLASRAFDSLTAALDKATEVAAIEKEGQRVAKAEAKLANQLERLTSLQQRVTGGITSFSGALREASRIRETFTSISRASGVQRLPVEIDAFIASIQRRIRVNEQATRTSERFALDERRANDDLKKNKDALAKLADIRRSLARSGVNLQRAQERAASISVGGGSGLGQLVAEAQRKLIDNIERRITVQNQANSTSERLRIATEEGIAARKQEESDLATNQRALAELAKVNRSLAKRGVDLQRARERALRVGIGGSADAGLGRLVRQAQEQALRNIQSRANVEAQAAASSQRFQKEQEALAEQERQLKEQAKATQDELFALQSEAQKNTTAFNRLQRIEQEVEDGLLSLSAAIRQASRIEGLRDVSDRLGVGGQTATLVERERDELVDRLRTQQRINEDVKFLEKVIKDEEKKRRELLGDIDKQNTLERQRLGITQKQLDASSDVLRQIELEAEAIVQGREATEGGFTQLVNALRDGASSIRSRIRGGPAATPTPGGLQSAGQGNSITFRGAADLQAFARTLQPKELAEFSKILSDVSRGAEGATRRLGEFSKNIKQATTNSKAVNLALRNGKTFAFDFGKTAAEAARRLLAWAAPSQLIFTTVSLLRSAVSEIIALDTAARRLVFFQSAGSEAIRRSADAVELFRKSAQGAASTLPNLERLSTVFSRTAKDSFDLAEAQNQVFQSAIRQGIALRSVSNALIEVSRVGQDVVTVVDELSDSTTTITSDFSRATLQLLRLSGGAIQATEAVRGLNAVQAQFFGGRTGFVNALGDQDEKQRAAETSSLALASATSLIGITAARSAASERELIDASTRVGAAFQQILGLNFAQTVSLIGEAFSATGSTAGRLATALRQVATLIPQNAEALREVAGVEVIDENGLVRSQALFEILEEIRKSAGTIRATEISLLIADRRNIGDIQALANSVDSLTASTIQFATLQGRISVQVQAAVDAFREEEAQAASLDGRLKTLRASFVQLVQSAEIKQLLDIIINFGQASISAFQDLVGAIQEGGRVLTGVVNLAQGLFTLLAGAALFQFIQGLRQALQVLKSITSVRQQSINLLRNEATRITGIIQLEQQGLLTKQRANQASTNAFRIQTQLSQRVAQISRLEARRVSIVGNGLRADRARIRIANRITQVQGEINVLKRQELRLQQQITREANAAGRRGQALQRGAQVASVALFAVLGDPAIEETIAEKIGAGTAKGVISGLEGAAIGAAVAGPIGAAVGAVVGIIQGAIAALAEETRRLEAIGRQQDIQGRILRSFGRNITGAQLDELGGGAAGRTIRFINRIYETLGKRNKETVLEARDQLRDLVRRAQEARERGEFTGERGGERAAAFEAELSALQQVVDEAAKLDNRIGRQADRVDDINQSLSRQQQITQDLLSGNLDVRQELLARTNLQILFERVQRNEISNLQIGRDLEFQKRILAEERLRLQARINSETKIEAALRETILAQLSDDDAAQIKIQLDQATFRNTLLDLQTEIDNISADLRLTFDPEKREKFEKDILKLRQRQDDLQIKRLLQLTDEQQKISDGVTEDAEKQVKAWESAASTLVSSFKTIVSLQEGLARIFQRIGKETSDIIQTRAEGVTKFLESTGASLERRLTNIIRQTDAQLANAREVFSRQLSTVGRGFSGTNELTEATSNLIEQLGTVIANSDKEITDERRGGVNLELARIRQRATDERSLFELRIRNTRREIEIRRELANQEIAEFRKRLEREQAIFNQRVENEAALGRLLLESPDKFNEAVENVRLASQFFRGVTDVNIDGLQTISRRVNQLRGRGQEDLLARVARGTQVATQFGLNEIIGGVGNQQLQQIFERIQIRTPEALSKSLDEQRDLANQQAQVQKEINDRQRRLVALSEFDAQLQQSQIAIEQQNAALASAQREAAVARLGELNTNAIEQKSILSAGLNAITTALLGQLSIQDAQRLQESGNSVLESIGDVLTNLIPRITPRFDFEQVDRQRRFASFAEVFENLKKGSDDFGKSFAEDQQRLAQINKQYEEATKKAAVGLQDTVGELERFKQSLQGTQQITNRELAERQQVTTSRNLLAQARNLALEQGRLGVTSASGRRAARRTLRDDDTLTNISRNFGALLEDTPSSDDFIDIVRELRGEGRRGVREIDPAVVQRFLLRRGFEGAARGITTRGQAADVLDRFIKLSEQLAEDPLATAKETRRTIVQVLGEELRTGIQDITNKTADAAAQEVKKREAERTAREGQAGEKVVESINNAAEKVITRAVLSKETTDRFKEVFEEGGTIISQAVSQSFEDGVEKLEEADIVVDLGELSTTVTVRAADQLAASDLAALLREALVPLVGNSEKLDALSQTVAKVVEELVRKGIIPLPTIGGRGVTTPRGVAPGEGFN